MFDRKKFKDLIEKAIGNNSITEYAQKSGVNRTYISKYINLKLDNPPNPNILKDLANASEGKVDYKDFMTAAGYLDDKVIDSINKADIVSNLDDFRKKELMAEEIIEFLIKKGIIHEGEELNEEKLEWIKNLLDKAIDMSRM